MPKYPVMEPLRHDGVPYCPGGTVEMEAKEASHLLKLGVLGPAAKADAKADAEAKAEAEAKADAEAAGQGEGEPKKPAAKAAKPGKGKK